MQERVMILRIVDNNDHSFSASKTLLAQLLQKLPTAVYNRLDLPAPDREKLAEPHIQRLYAQFRSEISSAE
jgi:hypothetical protein